jgi:hypothetical protein
LLAHFALCAESSTLPVTGKSSDASVAMMPITTSSSRMVKAALLRIEDGEIFIGK